ncbi:hypothetical protein MGYG_01400 [Nannizzia gypsea CBS 118893]|uniref:Uncharacterized protein n=1 Tax=Arthroderma gypseum (strain ATCC MYA-4604 / CBS 118893) TaxID=535722 RepID=E5R0M5_ARTGP|nr:40S ribosomal protein S30 [Nannizzia gypsea CBS 118893]EFQ98369.1 hypothetical protein MGYG_01400 [Nannizzia gypsea CBS 118893]
MGKVHGSLARAGKFSAVSAAAYRTGTKEDSKKDDYRIWRYEGTNVNAVEPQEKKKTPKGRAKKRLQYTRRFVNVTMTGGKRKMNPNPGAA